MNIQSQQIYKTSPGGAIILTLIAIVIFTSYVLGGNDTQSWIFWIYILLLGVAAIDMRFGIHASLQGGNFSEVRHFIFKRSIEVADIGKILYQPTWAFGDRLRSVYLIDRKTNRIKIRMSNGAYPPETLSKIVADLKNINKTIQLDDHANRLMETYAKNS